MEKITSNLSQFDRSGDELSKQKSIIIRLLKLHLKIGDYNFWILYKLVCLLALLHLLHYYTYVCIIRIETRRGLREQSLFLILFLRIFVNLQQFPSLLSVPKGERSSTVGRVVFRIHSNIFDRVFK